MPTDGETFAAALRAHAAKFSVQLADDEIARMRDYYDLVMKWNARLHLVGPCSPEEFATRHVLESLMLVGHLAANAHVIDVGAGAGLPSMPCLIVREDIRATLIESSKRKAVFLKQALRDLGLAKRAEVVTERFPAVAAPPGSVITCRALDRFESALPQLARWAPAHSLLLLFGGNRLVTELERHVPHVQTELIPRSQRRFLIIATTK